MRDRYKLNLISPRTNQVTFGNNSLKSHEPKIWDAVLQSWTKNLAQSKEIQ